MPLLYEKQDHIGILTLSRPEARNAWCNEFTEVCRSACRNWRTIATSAA